MRLQLSRPQHGVYGTGGQAEFGGQGAHRPAALTLGLLTHPGLQLVPGIGIMLGRPERGGSCRPSRPWLAKEDNTFPPWPPGP
jgi:hypothetical protein